MSNRDRLAEQFELSRPRLRSVAYSMLGSVSEAEDAVQECWLRLDRSDAAAIDDLRGWLTTVVGRICLDMLRARKARREDYAGTWLPEPLVEEPDEAGPEHQAELADSIGMALLVVLESLTPSERLAFVLHDVFALPFEEIAQIMDRSPRRPGSSPAAARRRVQAAPRPDPDLGLQRRVVDAFLAAAREGDFDALLSVLAPDVVLRFDLGRNLHPRVRWSARSRLPGMCSPPPRGTSRWPPRSWSTAVPAPCSAAVTGRSRCSAAPWSTGASPHSTWSSTRTSYVTGSP